ncbi:MAG: hypothetical protein MUC79_14985 [Thiobacillaceae bacterium]|jgi:hypothetical protein|nr:hypothetical protein [Thiobacillaceae bacterium]
MWLIKGRVGMRMRSVWMIVIAGCCIANLAWAQSQSPYEFHAHSRPLILIVEGVNPYRLLGPLLGGLQAPDPALEAGYLERSPLAAEIAGRTGGEARRVPWSGVPTDAAGLRQAIDDLKGELRSARSAGRTVHLVTHSLGSVIAYLALAELAGEGGGAQPPPTSPGMLISLASPLGRPAILLWLAQWHPGLPLAALAQRVDEPTALGLAGWVNVYVPWDPLGGRIEATGVENRTLAVSPAAPLPSLAELVLAHTLPFRSPAAAAFVAGRLADAPSAALK